jgi:hypothetical protein
VSCGGFCRQTTLKSKYYYQRLNPLLGPALTAAGLSGATLLSRWAREAACERSVSARMAAHFWFNNERTAAAMSRGDKDCRAAAIKVA